MQSLRSIVMQNRYPQIMVVMVIHHSTIMVVVSVEIQWYLAYILVLLVEQKDMQTIADHGPDNNTLYPHGPQPLVTRDSNEQNAQVLTPGHHVDKRDRPLNWSSAKPNRNGKWFRTYPELNSDEDISSEEFMHRTPDRLPMTVGWVQQDQIKQLWSRGMVDDPYHYNQTSDWPHH